MTGKKRAMSPLDAAGLERLALRYVERFATTQGRLADYLVRKIRERGWAGAPADPDSGPAADPMALAQRMADLGYVDDRAYADAKATAMGRRGLGARRITIALRQARVELAEDDEIAVAVAGRAIEAALIFARRRRLGPFGEGAGDRVGRARQIAAMARAGHGYDLSRRIVEADRGIEPDDLI